MYAIYIILHYNIQVYAIYNLGDLILVFLFANSGDPNQWLINLRKWSTSSLTIKGITKQVQEQRPHQAGMEKGHCTCAHLAHLALSGGGVASGPRRAGGKWPALKCLMGDRKSGWTTLSMVFRGKEKHDQTLGAEDTVQKQHFYFLLLKLCYDLSKCIFIFYGKCYDIVCHTCTKEFKYPCNHLPL